MSRAYLINEIEQERGAVKDGACFIFTQNRFNNVLMFKNQEDARNWCKHATRWTDEEIKKNIVFPSSGTSLFSYIIQPTN